MEREEQWLISVGIDLGTSTTKCIVSRLRLGRMSSAFSLPRFQIVERQLLYASPIMTTPLTAEDELDTDAIFQWMEQQYRAAGVRLQEIKSGAVIITGETATKRNAERIVHLLAERSGDFVVATAGASLEGVLAGKGAGAEARSREIRGIVANIDIGGGTANAAFFERGRVVGTVTFHVGGRLIRLTPEGKILFVSAPLAAWLNRQKIVLQPGQYVSFDQLSEVIRDWVRSMLDELANPLVSEMRNPLLLGEPLKQMPVIAELMVTGGIGQLMSEEPPETLEQTAVHGDVGPLLAKLLCEELPRCGWRIRRPEQTVRATVIGAGMQATEISGSTVFLNQRLLPVRNLPVVKLIWDQREGGSAEAFRRSVTQAMRAGKAFDEEGSAAIPFALALGGLPYCSYAALQLIAGELADAYRNWFPQARVLPVVCEHDMAKALGQALSLRCQGRPEVICIDQIKVEHGDYIDLGEPISDTMIPVVIKTLAFS